MHGNFLASLSAFGLYTVSLIILAGQAFSWKEDRTHFYVGRRRFGFFQSLSTFCATWMSGASLLGCTMYLYQSGYEAFTGSINGWLLGLVFLPFIVTKLRKRPVLSLPEWLGMEYGDGRLRTLSALCLIIAYALYIVIQFVVFAKIVGAMLNTSYILSSLLVYLFVLYTTFGGMPAVVRSDMLNFGIIIVGITVAAVAIIMRLEGGFGVIHEILLRKDPSMLKITSSEGMLFTFAMILGWGFGVAANPQYAIRIISARTSRISLRMLAANALSVGWIYICITVIGLGGRALLTMDVLFGSEAAFTQIFSSILHPVPAMFLLLAVLAASVSSANSQLLLAACSWCYDVKKQDKKPESDPMEEDRFLLHNRMAIAAISTVSLLISFFRLPGILILGRYSWALVAICFFLPFYFPVSKSGKGLFTAISAALLLHTILVVLGGVLPEIAMLPALVLEAIFWKSAEEDGMS